MEKECAEEYVKTNIGLIPLEDYYDIEASKYGYNSYADLLANGFSIEKPLTVVK